MNFVPASELVGSMELMALPEGTVPLEAVVLIKALDPDGEVSWSTRFTKNLTTVESVGALTVALDLERRHAVSIYIPEADDD